MPSDATPDSEWTADDEQLLREYHETFDVCPEHESVTCGCQTDDERLAFVEAALAVAALATVLHVLTEVIDRETVSEHVVDPRWN